MTTPPPSAVTDADVEQARRLGEYAGRRSLEPTSCPYDPAGDARQRVLASAWMRGYLHVRPPAPGTVDYSGDDPGQ